jgi:CheY-like chemotaxis protein
MEVTMQLVDSTVDGLEGAPKGWENWHPSCDRSLGGHSCRRTSHGGEVLVSSQRVLIVDPSVDSREVIRTALERRGVAVFEADNARVGAELARQCRPDLVVVDGEVDGRNAASNESTPVDDVALNVPRVVLGKVRRANNRDRCLAKPYQYATLIRTIEELLETASHTQRPAA